MTGRGVGSVLAAAPDPNEDPIPRDHNDWPIVPDPNNPGHTIKCLRPSQLAKNYLTDSFAVDKWRARSIAVGAGRRPDLAQLAAPLDPKLNRGELDGLAEQMLDAGGGRTAANMGTARHTWLELLLGGASMEHLPPDVAPDVAAIARCIDEHGMMPLEGWQERFLICPEIPAAGSVDTLATSWAAPGVTVADLKTSQNDPRDYSSPLEISVQLACYARASWAWSGVRDGIPGPLEPTPEMNLDVGLVLWAPAGQGRCELIPFNLAAGWDAIKTAQAVKAERQGVRKRFVLPLEIDRDVLEPTSHQFAGAVAASLAQRIVACRRRLRSLVDGVDELQIADIGGMWPHTVVDGQSVALPSLKHASAHSDASVAAIEALIDSLEAGHDWVPVDAGHLQVVIDRVDALPVDLLGLLEAGAREQGVPNLRSRALRKYHVGWLLGALEEFEKTAHARGVVARRALGHLEGFDEGKVCADLSGGSARVVDDLTQAEISALTMLGSIESQAAGGVEVQLSLDNLVKLAGSKSDVVALGKAVAADLELGVKPRSAAQVADSWLMAAHVWWRCEAASELEPVDVDEEE